MKEKRFRYSCHYNVRHPGQCDGQSGYGVTKLDAIVESIVCTKFSEILECSKSKLLQDMLRRDMEVAQKEVSRAKSELDLKGDERNLCMWVLSIVIFVIVYGRMIEIYLTVSLAPIPFSTMANREWGQMGTGYLRSLFALGFQGFLILICVAIYAVLVQSIPSSGDVHGAIWGTAGYTVLLAFALFKTGSLSKSIFNAR